MYALKYKLTFFAENVHVGYLETLEIVQDHFFLGSIWLTHTKQSVQQLGPRVHD